MRRLVVLLLSAPGWSVVAAGCGSEPGGAADTLPQIATTSTTSTTTTVPDDRRKFYEVESGDRLADIADRYCVTPQQIADMNGLEDEGNYLEVGQILELPIDVVLVNCSAYTTTSTTEPDE
jgi:LysM repeat protein